MQIDDPLCDNLQIGVDCRYRCMFDNGFNIIKNQKLRSLLLSSPQLSPLLSPLIGGYGIAVLGDRPEFPNGMPYALEWRSYTPVKDLGELYLQSL